MGLNVIYGFAAQGSAGEPPGGSLYDFFNTLRKHQEDIQNFAASHGFLELPDRSGAHIDCQIIDTGQLKGVQLHPELKMTLPESAETAPVILVIDYAFGAQAFEIMENLLESY